MTGDDSYAPIPPAPPPRRCTQCYYVIDHLAERGQCPECGQSYDLLDPATYTTKPPLVWWTLWFPGFATALIVGLVLYVSLLHWFGYTWTSVMAVPAAAGVLLGYRTTAGGPIVKVLLGILLAGSLALGLFSMNIVGVFCGLVMGLIALGPIIVGIVIGVVLRTTLKQSSFSQRMHLPILVAIPVLLCFIEGRHPSLAIVSTQTSLIIHAGPEKTWNAIQFYEQVKRRPPWLLRLTPSFRPMYTTGNSAKVGDVKICVYERGHLAKQITEVIPGKRLAFRVIEQVQIEDDAVRLIDGSFDLEPTVDGGTRVTLTTTYQPLLEPRFAFLPAESLAVHTLHGHVLAGMKDKGESQ